MKNALTIAGSDSSGGAGIQADLKAFSANGVFGMSVITAVTAQNTQGVLAVEDISTAVIQKQIEAIYEDIQVDAVKVGMVSRTETIEVIGKQLQKYQAHPVVVDPVMVSKSGFHLLQPDAVKALIHHLLPLATIVTPNIPEAEIMTGMSIKSLEDMEAAAELIYQMGPANVLLKGGHLTDEATDVLFDGAKHLRLTAERIPTKNTHGTGCTLSSAIAANLAQGRTISDAVRDAKAYLTIAIRHSLEIGKGVGPTHHFYELYRKAGIIDE
ncbi:MAG: bifunctional hydroxymethylpyrimidine kinase/phosphomethylpyrimidine kinase [Firmicutes bacterium]|nr:bifunctional hydroxymethylpyrimidine kinase/phosphomethylpyrimidine kinase [Bacillota bacterium]